MHSKILAFLVLGITFFGADGLKCYSCTLTVAEGEENPDLTCINNVHDDSGKVKIITCPQRMKFCTTVRHDYISTGGVSSFERNCAEDPVIMDDDITGGDLESHYRTCTSDLCNKGTGLETIGNGNQGSGGGIVIDGVKGSGIALTASAVTFWSLLLLKMAWF